VAITSATDDFSEGSTVFPTTSTGSYAISKDGTGSLSFNNALGTINLAVRWSVLPKSTWWKAIRFSTRADWRKSRTHSNCRPPSGTFVFREHDLNALQSVGSVGAFTVSGGVVSAGSEDVNRGGVLTSLTSLQVPLTLRTRDGRGSGTLTDSSPATSSFFYYIVDANSVRFLSGTSGITGSVALRTECMPALSGKLRLWQRR